MVTETPDVTPAGSTASGEILRVSDLTLHHLVEDRLVIDGAFMSVDSGEVLGVMGESGSGKSALLFGIIRLLLREVEQRSGRIVYRGEDLMAKSNRQMEELRGLEMAMIVPGGKFSLNPVETAGSQIVDVLKSHFPDRSKKDLADEAIEILRIIGIPDPDIRFRAYPHELSGGMAQRILIAKAMACSPQLLLGDEFTVGLDVTIQAQVMDHFHALLRERNTSLVLTTSDLGIAATYCDTIAVIRRGQIVEYAPVLDFFANPQHSYSRLLLSAAREARAQQKMDEARVDVERDTSHDRRFVHEDLPAPSELYTTVAPGHLVRLEDE